MHTTNLEPWKHDHTFGQDSPQAGERRTLLVVAITLVTMGIEIAAGVAFGSMALLADGLHMGSHALGLGIAAFAYIYARRHARNPEFSFGTGKVNSLGGFTGALLLVGFAVIMAWESIERAISPVAIQFDWAIAVAIAGLAINVLCALILGGHGLAHRPHHDHDHDHAIRPGEDHNLRAAYLHVIVDAMTSVLAIVALLVGKYAGAVWLDPAIGLLGAALVIRWAWLLLKDTSGVLLDRRSDPSVRAQVREAIEGEGDDRIADLHVWQIGPGIHAAALSVVTHQPREPSYYKECIPRHAGVVHTTIEVQRCD
ncbi:cation diffusion facilitator family transporter [Modicisalibacter muralis]|uniref:Cation diffusion facilitator family transporter n=1 Tax=Modicisalibacter muralis TaxID=119000 RepID=A0A1G9KFS2_9GAMM|nr:CDF family Co(II)/Ni(II) efflux transporter DmeF [Halomonas muralis]SDL48354.1 cation diffusion facilitator family transporter [Halomonas muralis]